MSDAKECSSCKAFNALSARVCRSCGEPFAEENIFPDEPILDHMSPDMVSIGKFARIEGITEDEVIAFIRKGSLTGIQEDSNWYVNTKERLAEYPLQRKMVLSTTSQIEGKEIKEYHGVVAGEAILGVNVFRDLFASVRNVVGGRVGSYEKVLRGGRSIALEGMCDNANTLNANAVVGINVVYQTVGKDMLMIATTGTAVSID